MATDFLIDNLPIPPKPELMERLCIDLAGRPDDSPSRECHGDVLAQRLAELEAGKIGFIDWDDAKKQLLGRH